MDNKSAILNQEQFWPPRFIRQCLETFGLSPLVMEVTEVRNADRNAQDSPTTKNTVLKVSVLEYLFFACWPLAWGAQNDGSLNSGGPITAPLMKAESVMPQSLKLKLQWAGWIPWV